MFNTKNLNKIREKECDCFVGVVGVTLSPSLSLSPSLLGRKMTSTQKEEEDVGETFESDGIASSEEVSAFVNVFAFCFGFSGNGLFSNRFLSLSFCLCVFIIYIYTHCPFLSVTEESAIWYETRYRRRRGGRGERRRRCRERRRRQHDECE